MSAMLTRAYALLEIKSVDEEKRIIEGVASTPSTDRMGDIVEPLGGEFKLPLPFLWQHEGREAAIGHVISAKPTKDGIPVRIQIESDDQPGILKDRLDYAWRSIVKGLVRGLSIGFNPLEVADIKGTWGYHFISWQWLELSAVTIPANSEATITSVKSFDMHRPAATGTAPQHKSPGASGPVRINSPVKAKGQMKTLKEQIAQSEATRQAKAARMQELMSAAGEKGETLDAQQEEEYDTLQAEVASVDKHLVRLRALEQANAAEAKAVDGTTAEKASESRSTQVVVKHEEKLEPGIAFARFAMCVLAAKNDVPRALSLMERHYPQQKAGIAVLKAAQLDGVEVHSMIASLAELRTKANVPAGTTTDATWASPLVAYNSFAGDFVEYLRPRTIIGQFGQNGVPELRRIPFNVHIKGQTSGGTSQWVGEGKPKPVTKFDFVDAYHGFTEIAAISVITERLIRFSDPSAERLVREGLSGCVIERMDSDFVDPAITAIANVRPASITNGVSAIPSTGSDAEAVRADIAALWAAAVAANLDLTSAVYITTPAIAMSVGGMRNALGQREFPDVGVRGGKIDDVPTIVSNYVPAGTFILAFASEIYFSDDGTVTIDASNQASIQMLDNPTNDSVTPTPTSLVSMFQTDSVALRAHRFVNWGKRRTTAVALLTGVEWGGLGS